MVTSPTPTGHCHIDTAARHEWGPSAPVTVGFAPETSGPRRSCEAQGCLWSAVG
jgi:hypothetical protein